MNPSLCRSTFFHLCVCLSWYCPTVTRSHRTGLFFCSAGPFCSVCWGPFCFLFQRGGCQSRRARPILSRRPISGSDIKSTTASLMTFSYSFFFFKLSAPRPSAGPLNLWTLERRWKKRRTWGRAIKSASGWSCCHVYILLSIFEWDLDDIFIVQKEKMYISIREHRIQSWEVSKPQVRPQDAKPKQQRPLLATVALTLSLAKQSLFKIIAHVTHWKMGIKVGSYCVLHGLEWQ